ncbi:MAG: class I SAM-dependent methyltransferase [Acetobacteraceae bacterium]
MSDAYVHGYHSRENKRLQNQAGALVDLLHADTRYPPGSMVLEAGCGVGAQTVTLARRSPRAHFTSIDISADSIAAAKMPKPSDAGVRALKRTAEADGVFCYTFFKGVGEKTQRA